MIKIHFPYNKRIKDFLPSYLLMILIPIAIGVYIFLRMESVINKQALDTNMTFIKQFSAVVDQNIREIEQFATFITNNKTVERIGNMYSLNARNIMNVTELSEQMLAYSISNENITDYFIYFPECDFIYSPRATYSTELFYGHRYFFEEGFEEFKQTLNNFYTGDFLPIFLHDYISNKKYLVYCKSFLGYKPDSIIANAFIIFDLSILPEIFSSYPEIDVIDNYMIITQDGRLIYRQQDVLHDNEIISQIIKSNSGYIECDGFIISKNMSSEEESWFYVVSTSTEELLKPILEIRGDALILFIVSIICSILLAYVLSINSYQPINNFLSEVKPILDQFIVPSKEGKNNIKNDFNQIENTLKKMADDNQTAAERINSMMPVVRNNLLLSILNGNMKTEENDAVKKILQSYGVYFQYEYFTVIIIEKFEDNMYENIKGKSSFMFVSVKTSVSSLGL